MFIGHNITKHFDNYPHEVTNAFTKRTTKRTYSKCYEHAIKRSIEQWMKKREKNIYIEEEIDKKNDFVKI